VRALGWGSRPLWLSIIVLIRSRALVARSTDGGLDTFWSAVTSRHAWAALKLSLWTSLAVACRQRGGRHGDGMVLVRDSSRQGRHQRAIDLPFALADESWSGSSARAGRPDVARRIHAVGDDVGHPAGVWSS